MEIPGWLARSTLLLGEERQKKLLSSRVLVAGLGGVGGYAAEMLVRAGIGHLTLIDGDCVEPTNINRQLAALHGTVGQKKTEVLAARFADINPGAEIRTVGKFMDPDDFDLFIQNNSFDYILDAIDSLTPKLYLIKAALAHKVPLVSVMGTGGKIDPSAIRIADLSESFNDGFARMIRKRLKKFGISGGFKVVFSPEASRKESLAYTKDTPYKNSHYGTVSYMPAMFGVMAASVIVRDLAGFSAGKIG